MVCFSAIIEREPLSAHGVRPSPNTAMEATKRRGLVSSVTRGGDAPFAAHRKEPLGRPVLNWPFSGAHR